MKKGSCFDLSRWFSHDTEFIFCSFPEVISCNRIPGLFFPSGFPMKQGSCFLMTQDSCSVLFKSFSHDTEFMFCSFPEVFL